MKKSFLLMAALTLCGMTVRAQAQEQLYKMKITMQDGSRLSALTDEVDSMELVEIGEAKVSVTERYKTSSSIAVDIETEASVSRVQAAIVYGSEMDPDLDYTKYVQEHAVADAKGSCTVAFDFLHPESIYTVYVLAYDQNGIPTGLTKLTTVTGSVADDPFTVKPVRIGTTTLSYTVEPKDNSIRYYTIATGEDYYKKWQNEEGADGDVLQHFIGMWETFATWYGDTWQNLMKDDLKQNKYESESTHLMWDARQVVISFGMDLDGNLITPIQVDSFHTNAPTPVEMEIPVTVVTNEWGNVEIKAEPSTDNPYFIAMQPAAYVEQFADDDALLRGLCYEADNINPATLARTRDTDTDNGVWGFRIRRDTDTDYYIIAVGLDEGAPATKAFKTKITVPGGSF